MSKDFPSHYAMNKNLFVQIHKHLGLLPGYQSLNNMGQLDQATQTEDAVSPLETVRRDAEIIATYVVYGFERENKKKPPNRFCKTMRRTVRELSYRHDIAFKGMVNKLSIGSGNAFQTFVSVAEEMFDDGQITWGRIVAVYAFADRLANHCKRTSTESDSDYDFEEIISLYVGKYVGNKLGRWILDNGGWESFADYFPAHGAVEDKLWKGLAVTTVGLWALAIGCVWTETFH